VRLWQNWFSLRTAVYYWYFSRQWEEREMGSTWWF